jgi:hypothetical protein
MEVLPTVFDGTKWYVFSVSLEGLSFRLEFNWNDREGQWYFNLLDTNNNPLVTGRKVVLDMPMIGRFPYTNLPNGDFMAIDTSGQQIPPSLNDLGDRVLFVYLSSTDIAQMTAGTFVAQ